MGELNTSHNLKKTNQYWSAMWPVVVIYTNQYWSRDEAVLVTSPTSTGRKHLPV